MLERQTKDIPLVRGVDETVDSMVGEDGLFETMESLEYSNLGSLEKPYGCFPVAANRLDGADIEPALSIHTSGKKTLLRTRSQLLDWSEDVDRLRLVGDYSPAWVERMSVGRGKPGAGHRQCDSAVSADGDLAVVAVLLDNGTSLVASLMDPRSKRVITPLQLLSTSCKGAPRCVATSSDLWVIWQDTTDDLKYSKVSLSTTSGDFGTVTTFPNTATAVQDLWDAVDADRSSSGDVVIAYKTTTTGQIQFRRYNSSGSNTTSGTDTTTGVSALFALALGSGENTGSNEIIVAYVELSAADHVYVFQNNGGVSSSWTSGTHIDVDFSSYVSVLGAIGVGVVNLANVAVVAGGYSTAAPFRTASWAEVDVGGTSVSAKFYRTWTCPVSRPFHAQDRWHFICVDSGAANATYWDMSFQSSENADPARLFSLIPHACMSPYIAGDYTLTSEHEIHSNQKNKRMMNVSYGDGSSWDGNELEWFIALSEQLSQVYDADGFTGAQYGTFLYSLNYDRPSAQQFIDTGKYTVMSGGLLYAYDGERVFNVGFSAPVLLSASPNNGSGSMPNDGVYQYVAVYEWYDSYGRRYQSAPSDPVSVTLGGSDNEVDLTFTGTAACSKVEPLTDPLAASFPRRHSAAEPQIVVYRTLDGGGENGIFYRLTTAESHPSDLYSDRTVDVITYTDTFADDSISSNEVTYSASEVFNDVVPAGGAMAYHRDRVWTRGGYLGSRLFFSKKITDNKPPHMSLEFYLDIEDGGDITGLASFNDYLIVFKRARIYVVSGDGPTDTGLGDSFFSTQKLEDSIGCIDPNSVVTTPAGVFFLSERGFAQLNDGLSVTVIGEAIRGSHPVRDDDTGYPIRIRSAAAKVSGQLVRWLYTRGGDSSNRLADAPVELQYQWNYGTWGSIVTVDDTGKTGACVSDNERFVFCYLDGVVTQEDPEATVSQEWSAPESAETHHVAKLKTTWLKAESLARLKRFWWVTMQGEWRRPHDVQVLLESNDGGLTTTYDLEFPTNPQAESPAAPYEVRVHVEHQRTRLLRVTLLEQANGESPLSRSFVWHLLSLTYGMLKAGKDLKEARSK